MMPGPLERQPEKLDYLSPTQFRFGIHQLPKVEFFVQTCNLPGLSMGNTEIANPFKNIPVMGDKIEYEDLNITFLVDEYLENYLQLSNWLTGIGFPEKREQFRTHRDVESNTPAGGGVPSVDTVGVAVADKAMYSDANLMVLSNKNNPIVEIDFKNVFPTSIGSIQFDGGATDVEYLTCDVTFKYQIYEIRTL
jgi:hypothetical protein|tara:strand:- start:350 stop:928 length:579 start_codon:yes stop_codon:yes gene_type:complete